MKKITLQARMNLHQKIVLARNQMGLTQQEVAVAAQVTVRTIQRIESGESIPRKYTLKLIATALHIPFEELNGLVKETPATTVEAEEATIASPASSSTIDDDVNFLKMLCLSCFSYLLIPFVHFLIPGYLLKKRRDAKPALLRFARQVIQNQIMWVIGMVLVFLLALGLNLTLFANHPKEGRISYLLVFFVTYFLNLLVISISYFRVESTYKAQKGGFTG